MAGFPLNFQHPRTHTHTHTSGQTGPSKEGRVSVISQFMGLLFVDSYMLLVNIYHSGGSDGGSDVVFLLFFSLSQTRPPSVSESGGSGERGSGMLLPRPAPARSAHAPEAHCEASRAPCPFPRGPLEVGSVFAFGLSTLYVYTDLQG